MYIKVDWSNGDKWSSDSFYILSHLLELILIAGTFWRERSISAPPFQRRRIGTADSALDNSALDISAQFPNLFLFFELWRKNNEAGNFLNAVEREPVQTRVLNPTVSEGSYKPK